MNPKKDFRGQKRMRSSFKKYIFEPKRVTTRPNFESNESIPNINRLITLHRSTHLFGSQHPTGRIVALRTDLPIFRVFSENKSYIWISN